MILFVPRIEAIYLYVDKCWTKVIFYTLIRLNTNMLHKEYFCKKVPFFSVVPLIKAHYAPLKLRFDLTKISDKNSYF